MRDLDIHINVIDDGAKQTLDSFDRAVDATVDVVAEAAAEVAVLETAMKKLGASFPSNELDSARARLAALQQQTRGVEQETAALAAGQAKLAEAFREMDATRITVTKGMSDGFLNAPAAVDKVTNSVAKGTTAMDGMDRIATRLVERMAILFALKGTFQFVEGIFQAAAKTDALAVSLDTTSEKVQELEFASRQTLVPIGALTGAMDTLGKKLIGGSSSTVEAIDGLGLSFDRLWQMNPSERFDVVSGAIATMGDKTQRAGFEIALFGTDKIDPVVSKLNALEEQAHASGQVMGDETVKQLAEADKAFKNTQVQLEILAAKWLVAAQNAVAYHLAATSGGRAIAGGVEIGFDANNRVVPMENLPPEEQERQRQKTIDAQLASMTAGLRSPGRAIGAGLGIGGTQAFLGNNPSSPDTKEGLAELAAAERVLGTDVRDRIAAEREADSKRLASFERQLQMLRSVERESEKAYGPEGQIGLLRSLDVAEQALMKSIFESLTQEKDRIRVVEEAAKKHLELTNQIIAKEHERMKVVNDAIVAELNARAAVNAAHGLDASGTPESIKNDPLNKANAALEDLKKRAQPGISQEFQVQQIMSEFSRATADGATAIVGMTTAERAATVQADNLSRSHAGATVAAGTLAQSFGQAAGVFMSSASSFYQATAQSSVQRTLMGGGFTEGEAAARAAGQFIAGVGIQKFATGGPVTQDGPIYAHAGEMVVPKDGMLVKGGSGGGVSVGDIHIHGNIDSRQSAEAMAARVADLILQKTRTNGPRIHLSKAG